MDKEDKYFLKEKEVPPMSDLHKTIEKNSWKVLFNYF